VEDAFRSYLPFKNISESLLDEAFENMKDELSRYN